MTSSCGLYQPAGCRPDDGLGHPLSRPTARHDAVIPDDNARANERLGADPDAAAS